MIVVNGRDYADVYPEVHEAARHVHNRERWFGAAVTPNAEIHVADNILTAATYLEADAGNDDWGAWLQILGSSDTPVITGRTLFDLHRIFISAVERGTSIHFLQIAWGATGAAALAAGNYTELVYQPQSAVNEESPVPVIMSRVAVGTKAWLRLKVLGQNTGYMRFFVGIHEYVQV